MANRSSRAPFPTASIWWPIVRIAQLPFQQAIIAAVAKVTHIAPADERGQLIGSDVISPGVIEYAVRELGLCTSITAARYTTITEVYPDSPRASPEQCNAAQVAAVCAAVELRWGGGSTRSSRAARPAIGIQLWASTWRRKLFRMACHPSRCCSSE